MSQVSNTAYCMSPHVNPTAACWNYLNVTQSLDTWWITNKATCDSPPYQGDGFGSCYQQLHGVLDTACGDVSLSCMPNLSFSAYTPQDFYVLQSMQNLWHWYSSIWFAAEDASLLTDLQAAQIVQTINPVHPGNTSLGVLLSALCWLCFPWNPSRPWYHTSKAGSHSRWSESWPCEKFTSNGIVGL